MLQGELTEPLRQQPSFREPLGVAILARMAVLASTAAWWSERVRAWRPSGETASEYAAGNGFAASTLRFLARRLNRMPSTPCIVQLGPRPALAVSELLVEVGAARVRVGRGCDHELLADVVAAFWGAKR